MTGRGRMTGDGPVSQNRMTGDGSEDDRGRVCVTKSDNDQIW